mmetsp:Transcript_27039/g.53935  ORF Transcript_27039/g.53935 Transcript_27039/m.53935 type:complete len:455 (-) Transcript_27039:13-1377(-)
MNSLLRATRGPQRQLLCAAKSYHIAVVGSGPSALYALKYMLPTTKAPGLATSVTVFEELPTPFGLVRSGVAPDHEDVKNVQNDFTHTIETSPVPVTFRGSTKVGGAELSELKAAYDAVILAHGCGSGSKLDLPGSPAANVVSSIDVVRWYNGHPYASESSPLPVVEGRPLEVVIVGTGNVSIDIARVLLKGDLLTPSDVTTGALADLKARTSAGVRVRILNRRGLAQSAFTIKEIRELIKLQAPAAFTFTVTEEDVELGLNPASEEELRESRPKKRIVDLLRKEVVMPEAEVEALAAAGDRSLAIDYLYSPCAVSADDEGNIKSLTIERQSLSGEAGSQRATGTGETKEVPCDLLIFSTGYKGEPLKGLEDHFSGGCYVHSRGHIKDNVYCTGWIKRGATGIVGSNIADARETVATIKERLEGMAAKAQPTVRYGEGVSWEGWKKIEEYEATHG